MRVRTPLQILCNHGLDAIGNLRRRVAPGIVRADHENDQLGVDPIDLPMLQSPKNMLGTVSTDAEVEGIQRRVTLSPYFLARVVPIVRDGITVENEIKVLSLRLRQS